MTDSKTQFESNPLYCSNHKDEIVYRTEFNREEVHQCIECGWGYIHNNETGRNYG